MKELLRQPKEAPYADASAADSRASSRTPDSKSAEQTDKRISNDVQQYARRLFETIYTRKPLESFDLERDLARLANDEDAYQEGLITPIQRQASGDFLNELLLFIKEKAGIQNEQKVLQTFIEDVQGMFFGGHPNIATSLATGDLLIAAAKATRIPQARGWLGAELVSQLGYKMNFSEGKISDTATSKLENKPPEVILDIIDQLQIVAANSLASYQSGEHGFDQAKSLIRTLQQRYTSPLIKYYAALALERIDKEPECPSVSFIVHEGDPLQGRIIQEFSEADQAKFLQLRNQINPKHSTPYGSKFLPIASDAIGLYDRSNLLRSIASADFTRLPPEQPVSMVDLRHLQDALKDPAYMKKVNACKEIITYINERVILKSQAGADLPDTWQSISHILDKGEWLIFFKGGNALQDIRDTYNAYLDQTNREATIQSEQLSDRFMERLSTFNSDDLQTLSPQQQKHFAGLLNAFKKKFEEGDIELAFRDADSFASGLRWIADEGAGASHLLSENLMAVLGWAQEMNDEREKIWEEVSKAREEYRAMLNKEMLSLQTTSTYPDISWKLVENKEQLAEDVLSYLEQYEQRIKDNYTPVDFIDLDTLSRESSVNLFGIFPHQKQDTALLLQHLHRPDMRQLIEQKLNLPLADLGIRSQTAFLEYLVRVDEKEFDRFCQFLNQYTESDRLAIASTFLAFEQEPDFSYIIERLCRHQGVGLPLIRYASSMIGNVESIRKLLAEQFQRSGEQESIARIHDQLIRKSYDILLRYNREVASLETLQELEHGQEILDELELEEFDDGWRSHQGNTGVRPGAYAASKEKVIRAIQSECTEMSLSQTLFLNTFRHLRESQVPFSLEDIKDSRLEVQTGPDINPQTKSRMREIYAENFKGNPEKQRRLLREFNAALESDQSRFYLFHYKDELLSFIRFDEKDDHALYAGSFNVDPQARGMKIGEAMMEAALDKEAKAHVLTGTANAEKPITSRYIEGGFAAVQMKKTEGNDTNLEVIRDDSRRHLFKSRSLSREEIEKLAPLGETDGLTFEIIADPRSHSFAPLKEKKYLTRYFRKDEKWYAVYERPRVQSATTVGSDRAPREGAGSTTSLAA